MMIVYKQDILDELESMGVKPGDILFVHSSLRSFGDVDGGADTVVDALLEAVGEDGTVAVPTFTFDNWKRVFDPVTAPSEMGAITEAFRKRPGAVRSHDILNSVAAIGPHAERLTATGPSFWAGDGPLWQLREQDAKILLLGVNYQVCTFFHIVEQLMLVPYREWDQVAGRLLQPDGTETPLPSIIYPQKEDSPGNDFNRLGKTLEEEGLVRIQAVGNAACRLFRAMDAFRLGVEGYRQDPGFFTRIDDTFTVLDDGVVVGHEKSVLDPGAMFPETE